MTEIAAAFHFVHRSGKFGRDFRHFDPVFFRRVWPWNVKVV
jgi:hypothetical protein